MLRFAISPTQDMNIGNLRSAIFNYIVSKQKNEDLVIRIDDTDNEKNIEGKDKEILELLNLFSIEHSRVIHQSDSLKYHQKMVMQLLTKKKAFVCFCPDEKIEELKQEAKKEGKTYSYDGFCENLSDETVLNTNAPFVIRIKKPQNKIEFNDVLKGEFSSKADEVDSFVVLRQDKTPTYNYACAFDDMLMDISTVIRDEKHLLDTSRQIFIREQLDYDKELEYIHLTPIDGSSLSVKSLIDEGFLPSAIANYLVLLGTKTPNEIFTLEEAIDWFDIKSISNESLEFDLEKLKSINKKHLEQIDEMRLSKILGFADSDIGKLAKIFLEGCSTIKEIKNRVDLVFSSKSTLIGLEEEFVELKLCLNNASYFDNLDDLEKYIKENTKLEDSSLEKALRYLLTGSNDELDISKIYPFIKNYLGEIVK